MIYLEDSIRIEAPPEVVFGQLKTFLADTLHYKEWHREHEAMQWLEGEPMTTGSVCYSEEFLMGRLQRLEFIFVSVIENRHVEYRPPWPLSILVPGNTFDLEPLDDGQATLFRASGRIKMHRSRAATLEATRQHMHEEGLALKEAVETR